MKKMKLSEKSQKKKKIFFLLMLIIGVLISYHKLDESNIEITNKEFIQLITNHTFKEEPSILNIIAKKTMEMANPIETMNKEYLEHVAVIKEEKEEEKSLPIVYLYNTHQTEEYKPITLAEISVNPTVIMNNYILQDILKRNNIESIVEEESIQEIRKQNNWNDFLNQLYINQFFDSSKVDINSININYEFLTSKKYISNPAIDCEDVIENLEIALLTPSKSAMLVGPPGVGKTAAAEGLAYMINSGHVPPALQNKKILKINTSSIVSGCSLLGEFEEKVEKIMQYLIENPDTILLVDEIHTTIGAGVGSKGALDLANIMKPYLDRGEIKVIGATTEEEYEEHIKSDKAFNRRFQIINVSEPQQSAVRKIMEETIEKLEQTTNVKWDFNTDISEMIISHITECTNEKNRVYNNKRYNPDISLTILENAFALALLRGNDSVSIENISEAIRRSDFLYKSVRTTSADKLLSKYHSSNQDEPIGHNRCKIIKFPNTK